MSSHVVLFDKVQETRRLLYDLHMELPKWGLVVWTAGNVSERIHGENLMVIKPSGVPYDRLTPESMLVCNLDGQPVDGFDNLQLNPSSDTAAHAFVYRNMPDVGGVVHTHSTFATVFAANRIPIPCVTTMTADEFGGEIPVGPFAIIGDDSIGRGIVETLQDHRSPAVLMANHGPFTIGKDAKAAVKAAVMCEEVAKVAYFSQAFGNAVQIDSRTIDKLWTRYQTVYGQ